MNSNSFSFATPKLPRENSIERLSFDDFYELDIDGLGLPDFPPKSLMQIVDMVSDGRSQDIHIFEWLDALENQQQWDELDDSQRQLALIAIWTGIGVNPIFSEIALFKIGLALDGKPTSVVDDISSSMKIARTVPSLNELATMRLDWLIALQEQDYHSLAEQALDDGSTLLAYVKKLRLPQAISYLPEVCKELTNCISLSNVSAYEDAWLFDNYHSFKATATKQNFCDQVITAFAEYSFGDLCKEIIEDFCLPTNQIAIGVS